MRDASRRPIHQSLNAKRCDWRRPAASQLHRWLVNWAFPTRLFISGRSELAEHGSEAFPGNGHQTAQEEEIRRLKRELDRVLKERDMLKKTLGIFTRDQL